MPPVDSAPMSNATRDLVERAPASRTALITIDKAGRRRELTFGELAAEVRATGARFASLGIGRGDVVYTMCGSRIEWVLTILACLRLGAVLCPCSPMLRANDLKTRAATASPRLVVADDAHLGELTDAGFGDVILPLSEWTIDDTGEPPPAPDLAEDDPAFLLFTSGSTGTPKPVWHAQRYVWGQHLHAEHWLGAEPGDLVWSTAAPGWSKSTRNAFLAPWLAGAKALIHEGRFDARQRLDLICAEQVTVLCMSPTEWRITLADGAPSGLPSLRRLVAAGEPLDADTIAGWRAATGLTIADGYGQTETGHIAGTPPGLTAPPGSAGRPLPGVDIRLHEGELQLDVTTLPTMSLVSDADLIDGRWWATGDLFDQDADGWLFFRSRADDVILSSGYRIDPLEVESALRSHPHVRDCLVAGVPDARRGEIVAALVVLDGGDTDHEALQRHVREVTAPYKYPRLVRFTDDLPRTTTGKIARGRGKELLRAYTGPMTTSMIERELKFELPTEAAVPELAGTGPVAHQEFLGEDVLAATYYDTEDQRLAAAKITLRRRSGGADAGWHLKLPTDDGHRQELHAPMSEEVPAELADRVSDVTGGEPLLPVARIDTTRSTFELRDDGRRLLATLADDQVVGELPQRSVVVRWRELEIELDADADEALLETLAGALRDAGVTSSPWPSKLKRLLSEGGAG